MDIIENYIKYVIILKEWNLNRDKTLGYSQDGNLTINLNSKCSQILQLKVLLSCNIVYLILLIYRSLTYGINYMALG